MRCASCRAWWASRWTGRGDGCSPDSRALPTTVGRARLCAGTPVTPDVDAAMERALELAAAAQEWGDTPIGAVVLGPDGAVLAEAANEREKRGDPTAHAEVLPCRRPRGCTGTAGG